MPDGFLSIDGSSVEALVADLKASERRLGKEQRKAHRVVAVKVAAWAQTDARGGSRQEAHFAGAIRPGATQNTARIRIVAGGRNAGAQGAFWGAKAYPQFPKWVGNSWPVGGPGGPLPNQTITGHMPQIEDMYLDAAETALSNAFPKG